MTTNENDNGNGSTTDNRRTVALITGGNRGLGRATALALAEAGTDVILTYRSGKDEAASVVDAVSALGRTAVAVELDTTRFDTFPAFAGSVREALRTTWDRDSFDFLVNNAGAAALTPAGETQAEAFDLMVDVHFKGVFFLTQTLLPLIADGGRVVNLSTGLTRFVGEGMSVYAAAKGAVEIWTKYLAQELGPRGISVNAVAPGPIANDFGGGMVRDNNEVRAALAGQTALGRVGESEDIGGVIASLLSPGTGWITAQRIEASGGSRL
ncbi:SDR family NAD(P)-dependent oxidoreductase [Streptomyces sp. NPDC057137]|uniref:SDR family NAD(P)-dependent oxidoreductase n=1 Tax=Streptomyces sp. NPDC057137 TaxID=3346030 RepID=UPI0036431382